MMTKLKLLVALFLALGLPPGVGLSQPEPKAPDTPPRRDLHGEPLPPGALVRLGTVRFQHDKEVTTGFFTADGKILTTAGRDNTARRWDVATGKELERFALQVPKEDQTAHSRHLLAPDGKTLATVRVQVPDGSTSVYLWDLATGKHSVLEGRPKAGRQFTNLAFSPDSAILAATSADGDLRLWDTASGALVRQITAGDNAGALAFGPGGALLAVATSKGIVVRDVAANKEVCQLALGGGSAAFSSDGKKLVAAGKPVRVFDLETGKTLLQVDLDEKAAGSILTPRNAIFSPDGKLLAVDMPGIVVLVDATTGQKVRTLLGDLHFSPKRHFFSPDGRYLAVPGLMNFHLYESETGKPLHDDGHRGSVMSVAFAPDGKVLATADRGAVRLWEAASGKQLRHSPSELRHWPSRDPSSLAFAPDGKALAHVDGDTIRLRDPATGAELPLFKSFQASAVAFSPDGALLATMSAQGPALWDAATGRNVRQFKSETRQTHGMGLAYSADGKTLATLATNGAPLQLWDTATGTQRHTIKQFVTAFALSPDGAQVAAYGGPNFDTRNLLLYDVTTGKQVGRFHTTDCQRCHMVLAYSPCGKTHCGSRRLAYLELPRPDDTS